MILCVGLTPTVQRTMRFADLRVGEVNRAREVFVTASGKGANVARVLTLLGCEVRLLQILGGDPGRFVADRLDADRVPHHTIWANDDAPTRTCTTLLADSGPTTELVEESRQVEPHDLRLIRAAVTTDLMEARVLCLSGSLPPGVDAEFYADLVREARRWSVPVLVDAQKAPLKAALAARPFLVKPNLEEAAMTLGLTLSGVPFADAAMAVRGLSAAGAEWALVSLGRRGSLLGNGRNIYRIVPPEIAAVNPIGSGDSLAAGILSAYIDRGFEVPEACRYGTAVAAANCLTPTSGVVDPADIDRLLASVTLEPFPT